MTTLAERVEVVEDRLDRLEALVDRFIEAVDRDRDQAARDREEAARERREMNKRWGDLANKMGTIVEDIIAPSVRRLAGAMFECGDEEIFTPSLSRVRSDDRSRRREFDALYVGTRAVLINETKSSPRSQDAQAFVDFLQSGEFALYFPEYRERARRAGVLVAEPP